MYEAKGAAVINNALVKDGTNGFGDNPATGGFHVKANKQQSNGIHSMGSRYWQPRPRN